MFAMTPMAEMELVDDVAFLSSNVSSGTTHHTNCDTCTCMCTPVRPNGRRRFSKSSLRGPSHGLSNLLSSLCSSNNCPNGQSNGPRKYNIFTGKIITTSIIALLLIVIIILIFSNPFSRCNENDNLSPSTLPSSSSSSSSARKSPILATNGQVFPWQDIRLPKSIEPLHYDLFMHPNLTTFLVKGLVEIILDVKIPVNYLVLHIKDINITEISVSVSTISNHDETSDGISVSYHSNDEDVDLRKSNLEIKRFLVSSSIEQLYIELQEELTVSTGNYTLSINFKRKLEEKLEGFYISSYNESTPYGGSVRKNILTTHFEPTAARSAFPCFDEPAFKATFALKMVHDSNYDVYFNADRQSTLPYNNEGLLLSVFDTSVRMSTYVVAFTVCDFKTRSARTRDGIHVRVLVPNEQYNQAGYALESAARILSYFQDFFNITYPLSKLDLMAVPDFGAGAMENWGLITFRTTMILFNEAESSSEFQETVAIVISHELGHQWFGNLVTMDWWSELWLNEGFASYLENYGVDHIHPEWNMLDQFIVTTTQEAMGLDALESSHPIHANVQNPSEIEAIFDIISYKKGSALIRMLESFLKLDTLRAGLSKYLKKYQYSNAQTWQLWQSFTEVVNRASSSINVTSIMDRWVKQKGFPVISSRIERNRLYLNQKRFLSSPESGSSFDHLYGSQFDSSISIGGGELSQSVLNPRDNHHSSRNHNEISTNQIASDQTEDEEEKDPHPSPFGYQWIIPITIITNKVPDVPRLVWLSAPDAVLNMDPSVEWFKLNVNQSGFYRVNYDDVNWRHLIELLHARDWNRHILTPADRSNLLDDSLSFMKVSMISADLAMNLTAYLETGERDYVPWATALKHFYALDAVMNGHPMFQAYVKRLLQPYLILSSWKDDGTHLTRKLRAIILKAAIMFGDENSIKSARRFFDEWMTNRYRIPPNFRDVVYTSGVRLGGVKEWEFCWKKYKNSKIPSEQRLLLESLASTKDPWLINRMLNWSLDRNMIKPQDTVQVLTGLARNPEGRYLVWRFVRSNWPKIFSLFGQGSFSMDAIISGVTEYFSTVFDYYEVEKFFKKVDAGSGKEAVKQSLERIRSNVYWKENVEWQVIKWLENRRANYRSF